MRNSAYFLNFTEKLLSKITVKSRLCETAGKDSAGSLVCHRGSLECPAIPASRGVLTGCFARAGFCCKIRFLKGA